MLITIYVYTYSMVTGAEVPNSNLLCAGVVNVCVAMQKSVLTSAFFIRGIVFTP